MFILEEHDETTEPKYPKKIPLKERIATIALFGLTAGTFGAFVVLTVM